VGRTPSPQFKPTDDHPAQELTALRAAGGLRAAPGVIRSAVPSDAELMGALYAGAINARAAAYHQTPPSIAEFAAWVFDGVETYLAIVEEHDGCMVGWCAIRRFHERAAYAPTAELYAYVAPGGDAPRGFELISAAVSAARARGLRSLIAFATANEPLPMGLAACLGFARAGSLPATSRQPAIGIFQRLLAAEESPP
jgi:L-amino acid N-acyltransferase